MMNFRKTVTVFFVICALIMSCNAVIAEDQVSFLLPINYFCVDDDQTVSTQQQLDEHSKDGRD